MRGCEVKCKVCQRNSIRPEESEAWPGVVHPIVPIPSSRGIRQGTGLARLIVAFVGLLLLLSHLAYAIFPWPVAASTAETAAYVTWNTDVAGSSQINYGTTTAYGSSTTLDATLVINHAQAITGLTANTLYHYQVVSTDGSRNTVSSKDYTFTTLAAPTGTVKTVKPTGGDYTSIQACANAASAGWTCEVYTGFSDTSIVTVAHGGNAGSPVTFVAHDAVLVPGFGVALSQSYVAIEGFEISPGAFSSYQSCSIVHAIMLNSDANYITISSNYIHNVPNGMFIRLVGTKSSHDQILNNMMAFANMANMNPPYSHPCSSVWEGVETQGDYNLVDGNDGKEADTWFFMSGKNNVFRRNVFHDTYARDWGADPNIEHVDFYHTDAVTYNDQHDIHDVLENNQDYNRNDSNAHFLLETDYQSQVVQQIGTGNGSNPTFTGTLGFANPDGTDTSMAPFSLAVIVGAVPGTVSGIDDGFEHIINTPGHTGISSGTINYSTGAISVTFSSPPGNTVPVTAYYSLTSYSSHDFIVRYNLNDAIGSGLGGGSYGGVSGVRCYNNTAYHNGYAGTGSQTDGAIWGWETDQYSTPNWVTKNEIYYDSWIYGYGPPWGGYAGIILSPPEQAPGYFLAFTPACDPSPGCAYTSSTTTAPGAIVSRDPLFANVSAYDFSLQSGSPARNAGTYLTTVASSDSGSGTSLIVNDAGFFQDSYGIPGVNADCIAVTTATNQVCITAVNYQTNTLTLASSTPRSAGDPVWLYSDSTGRQVLFGQAPNIGATFDPGSPPPPPPPPAPPTNLTAAPQ